MVHSVFDTIQGEGPFAGAPAVFVRLTGCNLQCPGCDTDYTSSRIHYEPAELLGAVINCNPDPGRLIVLTGGEPFRQNIIPFLKYCADHGRPVQIETNGTLCVLPIPRMHTVVVSPKTHSVHSAIADKYFFWKFILEYDKIDPNDGLPTSSLGMDHPPARPNPHYVPVNRIFVQPFDSGNPELNKKHAQAAAEVCMKYGYRLSLQMHKILELP